MVLQKWQDQTVGREPEGDHHIQHGNRHYLVTQQTVRMCVQVEDFWALYNHIELASRLAAGCDYSLFKEGVKPMWEDERWEENEMIVRWLDLFRNKKGGRWLINLDKKQRASCLDNFWLEVVSSNKTLEVWSTERRLILDALSDWWVIWWRERHSQWSSCECEEQSKDFTILTTSSNPICCRETKSPCGSARPNLRSLSSRLDRLWRGG